MGRDCCWVVLRPSSREGRQPWLATATRNALTICLQWWQCNCRAAAPVQVLYVTLAQFLAAQHVTRA